MTRAWILLIDDDPGELKALARYLELEDKFKVTPCASGQEAIHQLGTASQEYTAVLLDYVLKAEEMPGRQVLQELRDKHPQLPVIVFTGMDPEKGVQALSQGAYRYLRKPLDRVELVNILHSLAEQEAIFRRMTQDVRQMLGTDMCLAWRLDRRVHFFRIVAWDGGKELDAEYRRETFLDPADPHTKEVFENKKPIFLRNVQDLRSAPHYRHRNYAKKQGWTSLFSIPLIRQEQIIGLVDSYTYKEFENEQMRDYWLQTILPPFAHQAAEAAWGAELSNRSQVLQGLNEVLAGTFEEETILQQILAKGIELAGAEAGWVFRLDVNKGKLVLKQSIGVPEDQVAAERDLGEGITGWVAKEGEALNIPDVSKDERHKPTPGLEVQSEVAVPLRRGEQIVGALAVKSHFLSAFTVEDVSLLSSLAAQAAVAIGRADVTRHSQELGQLALTGDYQRLTEYIVEAARDLTGADVILWIVSDSPEEQGQWLRVKTSKGNIDSDHLAKARTPIMPGSSLTALALERGEPVVRRDIQDEFEEPDQPQFYNLAAAQLKLHDWHGFMAVPLLGRGGEPLGSLSLYGKETAKFGEAEVSLMRAFVRQVTIAFENTQIMERLDIQLEHLHQVVQGQSLEEVLDETLEGVNIILGPGTSSSINLYDEVSDSFEPSRAAGPLKDLLLVPPRSDGTGRYVLQTNEPLYLENVVSPPSDRPVTIREAYSEQNAIRSFAALPVKRQQRMLGVLFVNLQVPITFSAAIRGVLDLFASQAAIAIENALLLKELEERARRLKQLQDFTAKISAEISDSRKLLDLIVKDLVKLFQDASCAIKLYDSRTGQFDDLVSAGALQNLDHVPRSSGSSRYIVGQKGPRYLESAFTSLSTPDDGGPGIHPEILEQGVTAAAYLPLRSKGDVIGVMYVFLASARKFSDGEKQILRLAASQAAIAIEKAQLYDRRVRDIAALQDINEAAVSRKLERVLQLVVDKAIEVTSGDYASLWLLEPATGYLALQAIHMPAQGEVQKVDRLTVQGNSICARVVRTGRPKICPDVSKESDFVRIYQESASSLVVPLKYRGRRIGALNVESSHLRAFNKDHKRLLGSLADQAAIAIHSTNLLADLKRQAKGYKTLNVAGTKLAEMLDEEAILDRVAHSAADTLDCTHCSVFRLEKGELVLRAVQGKYHSLRPGRTFKLGQGVAGWVAQTGRPALVPNTLEHEQFEPGWSSPQKDPQSLVVVPILLDDRVYGVVSVEQDRMAAFDEQDQLLLETLAMQANQAVQNARLIERLRILNQVSGELGRELKQEAIFDAVTAAVVRTLDCTHCTIFALENKELVPRASHDKDEASSIKVMRRFAWGEGLVGWAAQEDQSLLILDAKKDERFSPGQTRPEVERSMIVVPVMEGGQVSAVISADQDRINAFNEHDLQMVETMALQTGVSLQNAHLLKQERQRADTMDLLRKVSTTISAAPNVEESVALIVQGAMRLTETDAGVIHLIDATQQTISYSHEFPSGFGHLPSRFSKQKGLTWKTFNTGQIVEISDVLASEPDSRERTWGSIKSLIGVPLKLDNSVIGVLFLNSFKQRQFTTDEKALLTMLAEQAALAIDKARRYEQRVQDISALQAINEAVVAQDIEDVLQLVVNTAVEVMPGEYSSLWLKDEETGDLILQAKMGPQGLVGEVGKILTTQKGAYWGITKTGKGLIRDDVQTDPDFIRIYEKAESSISVPLKYKDTVIGVLNVESAQRAAFNYEHQSLLQSLADQAAIAIKNAQSFEQLDRKVQELKVLTEIGRAVSNLGIDQILDLVYKQMCRIINLKNAQVQFAMYDREKGEVSFPLAMEQDGGKVIDIIRYGEREAEYSDTGQAEPVEQLKTRAKGTRFGLTEYVMGLKERVLLVDEFKQAIDSSGQADEDSFLLPVSSDHEGVREGKGIRVWRTFGRRVRPTNSWLGVPMIVNDQVIGTISIQSLGEDRPVDEQQLEALATLTVASQAAVAIENARLYERLSDKVAELKQAQKRIAETEAVVTRMGIAADIVHRLNNLAGTIPIWVDQIREHLGMRMLDDEELAGYLTRIEYDVNRFLRVAEQLDTPLKVEDVDPRSVLNSLVRQALIQTPAKIRIELHCEGELPNVRMVAEELANVFWSIMENGIDAMPAGGTLAITARHIATAEGKDWVQVRISDEGMGIAAEEADEIFSPFYSTKVGHIGYGLWRARNIVEKSGGSVDLEDSEGPGATFVVRLPAS